MLKSDIDPGISLEDEIIKLKKKHNAVILAHYYQDSEIQDLADFIGDSLQLSQQAAKTNADIICFAGVRFMAETAKIINPQKIVIVPDLNAGCSLADGCPASLFATWKSKHPNAIVVSYINCSAEVKALSDYIVTSSNAEKVILSIPKDQPILFAPDKNLGKYLMKKTGSNMELWQGTCVVHETFSERKIIALRQRNPNAFLLAHPECDESILSMADFIGSTTAILKYAVASSNKEFIVATEAGILHAMQKEAPNKLFIPAPPESSCACNECPFMKMNTMEKLYLCLRDLSPQIELPKHILEEAKKPIDRMLSIV